MDEVTTTGAGRTAPARSTEAVVAVAAVPIGTARRAIDRAVGDLQARATRPGTWRVVAEDAVLVLGRLEADVRAEHPSATVLRRARGYVGSPDDRVRTPVELEVVVASPLAVELRLRPVAGSLPGRVRALAILAREVEGWARAADEVA